MEKTQASFNTFFDEWFNTQRSVVNAWMGLGKQTGSNGNGNGNGSAHQPSGITDISPWKEWMEMQSALLNNWQKSASMFQTPDRSAMGGIKEWVDFQNTLLQNFIDLTKNYYTVFSNGEKGMALYQQFVDFQMNMMNNMLDNARNAPGMASSKAWPLSTMDLFGVYDRWREVYSNTLGSFGNSGNMFFNGSQGEMMRETLSNLMNSSTSYIKIFDYLAPIYKAMQQRLITPENMQQYLDPAKYKEILDRVFDFASPDKMKDLYELMNKLSGSWNATVQKSIQRVSDLIEKNSTLLPEMASGDPSIIMKMYDNILQSYKKAMDPYMKIPMEGKQAEVSAIMAQVSDKYSTYLAKTTQFQYMMYKTGQGALESMLQKVGNAVKEGNDFKTFNELFSLWVETNENNFINLFSTEDFAKLQGELVETGLAIRADFQKIMEIALSDYPIAPRSEIDEMAKMLHDVSGKLHDLEKEVAVLREVKAVAAAATAAAPAKKAVAAKAE